MQEDGVTLQLHLENYWKQSGVKPEQLDVDPIPLEIEYVWAWWLQLHETRQMGMEANHIAYTEVASWSKLMQIQPTCFEIKCIMALDTVYLNYRAEALAKSTAASQST